MNYRVKNIYSTDLQLTCYLKGKRDRHTVKRGMTVEIDKGIYDTYVIAYPAMWKLVNEPKERYLHPRILVLGGAILGSIGTIVAQGIVGI